ncbi:MAG: hypothetical protein PHU99_09865 [Candidatus Cloacimonetes bacterium]|jgi:hypothetical protein|nr:hypothetical protein [Candidatus Cloacimonadota bacterium]MDD2351375.1 hypothetical protein [Synergistaceae bacterium]MDD2813520.1 hypothetical protein [Bacteroidales bacterium]MDD3098012.1 hypothetical protein [Candidatus Cloacimonadota bacterium]MDD4813807.1 hypothetical protein [Bacteroidales bacterium]
MKKLLFLLTVITFISCNKREIESPATDSPNVFKYSKQFVITDKDDLAKATILVRTNDQTLLETYDETTFSLSLMKKTEILDPIKGGDRETNDQHTPDVSIEVIEVDLPTEFDGFSLHKNDSGLKGLAELRYYEYYSNGCYAVQVVNTDFQNDDISVRIGVLWTGSQWFYENLLTTDLTSYHDECGVELTYVYYKVRVRVSGDGDHDVNFFYNSN